MGGDSVKWLERAVYLISLLLQPWTLLLHARSGYRESSDGKHGEPLRVKETCNAGSNEAGIVKQSSFSQAVDMLQESGFVTELWVDTENQVIALRWVKKSARWHVIVRGVEHIREQLDFIGKQVIQWHTARESGTGKETNYAVMEQ